MTRIPLVVSKRQTIGELVELGAYRDFDRVEYDCRCNQFYGVIDEPAPEPLLRDETSCFLRPQAG